MSLRDIFALKRKKIENEEKSDGSDVVSSTECSDQEDTDDEVRKYRPGGYFNPAGKDYLKDNKNQKWALGERIGRGHFSTVYSVENSKGEVFACKIQKSAKSYRVAAKEEILIHEILSKNDDEKKKYICLMLCSFCHNMSSGKHFCMIFPKMRQDLDKYSYQYDDNRIPLAETSKISFDILNGMAYMHSCSLLHSDMKPENILVQENDNNRVFKLSDLGTACVIGDREYCYLQTSHYRSPEIILQHRKWNEKIDVWSMGCIVFECITGSYLFTGENEEDYMTNFVETIGMPHYSFLDECKKKREFFNRDGRLKTAVDLHPMAIDRMLQERYNFSREEAISIYFLLSPMLIWDIDERWSASSLIDLYKT